MKRSHGLRLTKFIEFGTVLTESFVVVPVSVPTLSWCDTTTFTPDACHTDLQRNRHISIPTTEGLNKAEVLIKKHKPTQAFFFLFCFG